MHKWRRERVCCWLLMRAPTAHSKPLEHDAASKAHNHPFFFSKLTRIFFFQRFQWNFCVVVVNEMKRARMVCVHFSWNEDGHFHIYTHLKKRRPTGRQEHLNINVEARVAKFGTLFCACADFCVCASTVLAFLTCACSICWSTKANMNTRARLSETTLLWYNVIISKRVRKTVETKTNPTCPVQQRTLLLKQSADVELKSTRKSH